MVKVGINGFGRMGRLSFREAWGYEELEIVHVNEVIGGTAHAAYLLQYDSVHGIWDRECSDVDETKFTVGDKTVTFSEEKDFTKVDWKGMGVDIVLECSGKFTTVEKLQPYLDVCGVKKVVVSAPVKEPSVLNIVVGVNDEKMTKDMPIVTAASCTTNCLAPIVKVIHENLHIETGMITTIHNITGTQSLVDTVNTKKNDLRRSRSGMLNLAPTSTGSATAIAEVFPELKGKLNGHAIRVPLLNSSITDMVFNVSTETTKEAVNALLKAAAATGTLVKNAEHDQIMGYEEKPLVSTDYMNDRRSSIVDALSTMVVDGKMVKIYSWYDNEVGYAVRMAEIARMLVTRNFL